MLLSNKDSIHFGLCRSMYIDLHHSAAFIDNECSRVITIIHAFGSYDGTNWWDELLLVRNIEITAFFNISVCFMNMHGMFIKHFNYVIFGPKRSFELQKSHN